MGERTELKAEQLAEARHEIREWLDASQVTICLSHHPPSYRGVLDTALALIDAELQRRSDSAGKCGTCDGTELVFDKPERYGYSFCPSCTSLASRSDSAEGGGAEIVRDLCNVAGCIRDGSFNVNSEHITGRELAVIALQSIDRAIAFIERGGEKVVNAQAVRELLARAKVP